MTLTEEQRELVGLLIERAENLNDPEAYHGDLEKVMLKAAEEIEALAARLVEAEQELAALRETLGIKGE